METIGKFLNKSPNAGHDLRPLPGLQRREAPVAAGGESKEAVLPGISEGSELRG